MNAKNLSENKRKYHAFRHHAWAGTVLLSVFLAIRLIFYYQLEFLTPVIMILIIVLIIYIIISLFFTYKYRSGLSARDEIVQVQPSIELEKDKLKAEVEKERLKLEKKRVKSKMKKEKKNKK